MKYSLLGWKGNPELCIIIFNCLMNLKKYKTRNLNKSHQTQMSVMFETIKLLDFCANSIIFLHPIIKSIQKEWEFDKTLSMSKTDGEPLKVKEKLCKIIDNFSFLFITNFILFFSSFFYSLFHISFFLSTVCSVSLHKNSVK